MPVSIICRAKFGYPALPASHLAVAVREDSSLRFPGQPAVDIATVYLGLRDDEETLRWLETGVKQRNLRLLTVPPDRRFHWLSTHARLQAILQQMGLQTAATTA